MARAPRLKLGRESTAAYAASQPLFDALRNGQSKIGEQKFLLTQARDLVQTLHVKLVNVNGSDDAQKHDRYIEHVVQAWRSATEVYSRIFEELANITAADASEGREASTAHEQFMAMSTTVEAAKKVAMSHVLDAERTAAQSSKKATVEDDEEERGKSGEDAHSSASSPPQAKEDITDAKPQPMTLLGKRSLPAEESKVDDQPPEKVQRLSDSIRFDEDGKKVLWERDAAEPNVPFATLGANEKKAWRAEKARQKREMRKAKRHVATAAGPDGRPLGPDRRAKGYEEADVDQPMLGQDYVPLDAEPVSAGKENAVPGLEYEDVSAEVEARLKAKEERKKAKKEEKKRKRESGDSLLDPVPVEAVVEKPKKKKVKADTVEDGKMNGVVAADQVEKRKKGIADAEEATEGRKKRKKIA